MPSRPDILHSTYSLVVEAVQYSTTKGNRTKMKTKKIAARRIVFIKQCKVELLSALVRETKQIWVNKVTLSWDSSPYPGCTKCTEIHFSEIPKLQLNPRSSLPFRYNLTPVSNICEAVPISLLWAPCGLNKLLEVHFELPFNLTGKMTMLL